MTRKILVSMDEELVRRIDEAARRAGLSRSTYLTQLASEAVGEPLGPGASPEVRGSLAKLDRLFARMGATAEATEAVRAGRDER